ncbi:MAG: hypothetical protein ACFCVD_11045 [Nodosilinea sp.]
MPPGEHSARQDELVKAINAMAKPTQVVSAFPKLRHAPEPPGCY